MSDVRCLMSVIWFACHSFWLEGPSELGKQRDSCQNLVRVDLWLGKEIITETNSGQSFTSRRFPIVGIVPVLSNMVSVKWHLSELMAHLFLLRQKQEIQSQHSAITGQWSDAWSSRRNEAFTLYMKPALQEVNVTELSGNNWNEFCSILMSGECAGRVCGEGGVRVFFVKGKVLWRQREREGKMKGKGQGWSAMTQPGNKHSQAMWKLEIPERE